MKTIEQKAKKVPTIRFAGFDDEWEKLSFADVGNVCMCKRVFKEETSDKGDIPFYKIGTFGGIPDAYITKELYNEYRTKFSYPEKGDILLSAAGTIGRIVEYDGESAYFQDSNIVWLSHDKSITNKFLKVLYPTLKWGGIEGSTIQRLYNDIFLKTSFFKPTISEQQKIGSFFSNIDSLISLEQKKYDKLTQVKKSMLEKMFPKESATVPEIRFANFTGEWEKKKLGNIGIVIDPHPSHRAPKEEPGGIPFIGIGDVDAMGVINRKTARPVSPLVYEDHHKRYDLSLPSLGLARVASLGKVIRLRADVGKYAVSPTMSVIQFNKTVDVDYVYSFMSTPIFQKQFEGKSNGSTRQSVGTEMVRILDVNIPPNIKEQNKIGSYFSHLDSLISLQQRKLEKLKNIKKSLLEKMFV